MCHATFIKGLQVKIYTLDINTEIAELEHNKAYKYVVNNEAKVISHTINKEKRKRILNDNKSKLKTELNAKKKKKKKKKKEKTKQSN